MTASGPARLDRRIRRRGRVRSNDAEVSSWGKRGGGWGSNSEGSAAAPPLCLSPRGGRGRWGRSSPASLSPRERLGLGERGGDPAGAKGRGLHRHRSHPGYLPPTPPAGRSPERPIPRHRARVRRRPPPVIVTPVASRSRVSSPPIAALTPGQREPCPTRRRRTPSRRRSRAPSPDDPHAVASAISPRYPGDGELRIAGEGDTRPAGDGDLPPPPLARPGPPASAPPGPPAAGARGPAGDP